MTNQRNGPELQQQQQVWEKLAGGEESKTKTTSAAASRKGDDDSKRGPAGNNGGGIQRTYSGLKEMVQQENGTPSVTEVPAQFVLPPHLQPGLSPKNVHKAANLPLIDMTGINDDPARRKQVVASIVDACNDWGFFQVVGHGVPVDLRQRMLDLARDFFELPVPEKAKFEAGGVDPLSPILGRSRTTRTGHHSWRDLFRHRSAPVSDAEVAEWPTKPDGYRETVQEYTQATQNLSFTLFELLAEGLNLNSQNFVEVLGGADAMDYVMMMAYYPRCPQPDLALGLIGHSDPNLITLLIQDEPGLEVKKDGLWIPVVPAPNGFVVNVGDSLQAYGLAETNDGFFGGKLVFGPQIMTNDKYKSIEHRVVASEKRDRVSAMIFVQPKAHVEVSVVQDLVPSDAAALYKDIPWGLYLKYAGTGLDTKMTNLALIK